MLRYFSNEVFEILRLRNTMNENGLTGCDENIRVFLGGRPVMGKTSDGRDKALFDVSWGIHNPAIGKFGTWRHCVAYDKQAEYARELKPGAYLKISGWITTNQVFDENGKRVFINGKPLTKEYLIVNTIQIIERNRSPQAKQLSLVA